MNLIQPQRIFIVAFALFIERLVPATSLTTKNILGNQESSADVTFRAPLGVDASRITCEWRHNGDVILIDGSKYVQPAARSLRITNIAGDDEGDYSCRYHYNQLPYSDTVARINVIGVATFAQSHDNLTASAGDVVQFDTRVTFVGGGAQQRKQSVNLLQVFKDGQQVYRCRNWSRYAASLCTSEGRFAVTMQGADKFDFYLSMSNVSVNDSGSYVAKLEVIHPETGSYSSIQKMFTLTVEAVNVEIPELGEPGSFQLCIGPFFLSDCSALAVDSQKGLQLENEIRTEIVRNVRKHCPQCLSDSSMDLIEPGKLRCSETAARLIYRSTIEAAGSHNSSEIVGVIEEWVTSIEATLHLWPFVMDLDSRCPVSIKSLGSPYPILGANEDQAQASRVKEHLESCLSSDNFQLKL